MRDNIRGQVQKPAVSDSGQRRRNLWMKELGEMEIIGLGELLVGKEEGSTTYGAGLTRESRPKDPKKLPEVELTGLRTESRLY